MNIRIDQIGSISEEIEKYIMAAFIKKPDSWSGFGDTTILVVDEEGCIYTYEA